MRFDETRVAQRFSALDLALVATACALCVAVRVWRLDAACLWFDEIFGVHAAAWHDARGMLRFVALDLIHPPLFYAVLKMWVGAFGADSVWWLRLLPVGLSCAAIVPVVLLARELGLRARVVSLALLLAAVSGTLIKYARELRMYSLLLLVAACSLWLFARLCNAGDARGHDAETRSGETRAQGDELSARRRDVRRATLWLFAANLALIYTHYFGWLVVALEVVFLALYAREKLKVFGASCVALAACFAPWAWAVWDASRAAGGGLEQNLGWAERPRLLELLTPYLSLHEPFRAQQQSNEPAILLPDALLALVLFATPIVALCWRTFAQKRRKNFDEINSSNARTRVEGDALSCDENDAQAMSSDNVGSRSGAREESTSRAPRERRALAFLVFFSFAPVIVAFVLAQVLPQSIWGVRHLIVVAPAYLLLAALSVERVRAEWLAIMLKVVLGCWLALASVVALTRHDEPPVWCAWDALAVQAAQDEATTGAQTDSTTNPRDATTHASGARTIYAFEDLIAYQLWHALRAAGETRLRVAVVRSVPGVANDRAFFLPRGFDDVAVETFDGMVREDEFWIALRGAEWDDDAPPVKLLRERGYDVELRRELDVAGQKAFVALARRHSETMKSER